MRNSVLLFSLFFLRFSFGQLSNSDCTESFLLTNNENNSSYTYNAKKNIITEFNYKVIASNNEINMKAGNVIVLRPNTYIEKGSLYLARIEPCDFCELNFSFPKFFTPNGDTYNDYWKVNWYDPSEFSEVSIFDRYGKLIKVLKNNNDTWDGRYNVNDLFSSDYWFKMVYTDCNGQKKEYKSHFSLKR